MLLATGGVLLYGCSHKPTDLAQKTKKYRPNIHFTPLAGWMNDPNGLVFFDDEFHLFYQHYPDSNVWGPMHWGHAVSKDLTNWEHLPIALFPDELGYIFSGSIVADSLNVSGLSSDEILPLLAFFTYHQMADMEAGKTGYQSQGIAYSLDKGRTWKKHHQNPILSYPSIKDFRDPKVFFHDASKKWVMILGSGDHFKFYNSDNLLDWTYTSSFGKQIQTEVGVWECPDLFPLYFEDKEIWVLLCSLNDGGPNGGSGIQYFLGDFDGQVFTINPGYMHNRYPLWLDFGKDNFAGVTWSGVPVSDGRRIFIGWMSNWQYAQKVPTINWRGAMTIPRKLHLKHAVKGLRIASEPVPIVNLQPSLFMQNDKLVLPTSTSSVIAHFSEENTTASCELSLFPVDNRTHFVVEFSNDCKEKISLEYFNNNYSFDRRFSGITHFSEEFADSVQQAPRFSEADTLHLMMILEPASIEIFADHGLTTISNTFFPNSPFNTLTILNKGEGNLEIKDKITSLQETK